MNFNQAISFLNARPDLEQRLNYSYSKDLELERVRATLLFLKNPHNSYLSILVAGTNGKGSVVAMSAAALQAHGYKVGVFTSPHLIDVRERIRINGVLISKVSLCRVIERVRECVSSRLICSLTYFELLTVIMFFYFEKQKIDVAVLEVGMGGRLDATNVVCPGVSVITKIGFDHEDKLGDTLVKIAREKAGIIKPGGIVVSGLQEAGVKHVIKAEASKKHATVFFVSRDRIHRKRTLIGLHQEENACIAQKTLRCVESFLADTLDHAVIKRAISKVAIPGRLELIKKRPRIYVDGAHNASALYAAIRALKREHPGKRIIAVIGISKDKDLSRMIRVIERERITVIVTESSSERSLKVVDFISRTAGSSAILAGVRNIKKALRLALTCAGARDIILICGSFYLVADYKKISI